MTDKTAKEITFKEHIAAIQEATPPNTSLNIEVRISWSKKLQDYVIAQEYYSNPSTLIRLTIRPQRIN